MRVFWLNDIFNDITLILDDGELRASKIILSAGSSYFKSVLVGKNQISTLTVNGMMKGIMWHIIDFMFSNSTELSYSSVEKFYDAASFFKIDSAMKFCIDFIKQNLICLEHCVSSYKFSKRINNEELLEESKFFILYNFSDILSKHFDKLVECEATDIKNLIDSDDLNLSEEKLFNFVKCWVDYKPEERVKFFPELFMCVRLVLMRNNNRFLIDQVCSSKYVLDDPDCKRRVIEASDYIRNYYWMDTEFQTSNISKPRISHNIFLAIGGTCDNYQITTMDSYDVEVDKWLTVEGVELDEPRSYHALVVIGYDVYIIGGKNDLKIALNTCLKFNITTSKIQNINCMQFARWDACAVELNGNIYVIGGLNNLNSGQKTVEMFDPKMNQWTQVASLNKRRNCADAAVINGKIYVVGGVRRTHNNWESSVEMYDPNFNRWEIVLSNSTPRYGLSCVAVDHFLYAIGGCTETAEKYDSRCNSWMEIDKMRVQRCNFGTAFHNGKIYVFGGFDGEHSLSSVEYLDTSDDQWYLLKNMPISRSEFKIALVKCVKDVSKYTYPGRDYIMETERVQILNSQKIDEDYQFNSF